MKRRIELSALAAADLDEIYHYGLDQHGRATARAYQARIREAFDQLAEMPGMGPSREELGPGLRSWLCRKHAILYMVHPDRIGIVRVLHQRRDIPAALGKPDEG